ncbi:cysteine hydrolase family protein [Leptolyngbya sp. FACHB-261]|uniref:cysteine hydrolase family protein n=1 Tax=Leptolyngbya sp. FACHB-261 TaxID=2692806 RepID=UPI00168904ED|nr:cysteine hydrolase family protein [Leptolyngbya sp. FACHB-261]MBD2101677.1 cysteine hydrolase [Leptolyngbya sp. FACHB-261]
MEVKLTRIPSNAVLIIIDVQKAIDHPSWGRRNNDQAETNIVQLLSAWRETHRPVVHVRHLSTEPGSTYRPGQEGCDFKDAVLPKAGEEIVDKQVNCAFIGTDLEQWLRKNGYQTLVVTGVITNNSVEATVRVAGNLGFDTYVVSDATATFDKIDLDQKLHPAALVHALSLANMHQEYATVIDTQTLLQGL